VHRHRILGPLVSALAALLVLAPSAIASKVLAPPGNAGVGQYVEVVPGAGGSTPVGAHSSHGPVLSAAQRQRLEAAGGSGKALASFVQRTGVAHPKGTSSKSASGHSAGGQSPNKAKGLPAASSRSLPAAVPDSATRSAGGGGLGWGLPAALAAIACAAAGIAVMRRRAA
jgi:hypothetical protein